MISKEDFKNFCRVLIDCIKEKISISNDDFDNYIEFIRDKKMFVDKIIEYIFSDNNIKDLLQRSNIKENQPNFLQAKRCTQIITLALLKCNNFNCLKEKLMSITGYTQDYTSKIIKDVIPFLNIFNKDLDIHIWLPRHWVRITYEECIKAAKNSLKNIEFVMTKEEFDEVMKNRGRVKPSEVKLKWKCKVENHIFLAPIHSIKKGKGCYYCFGNIPISFEDCVNAAINSDKNIEFAMTRQEFDETMENRGNIKPTAVKLNWRCKVEGHIFLAKYIGIDYYNYGCSICNRNFPITYDDCIAIAENSSKGIEFAMTKREFDEVMENRGKTPPTSIKLFWKCKNKGHFFPCEYYGIQKDQGCPFCGERKMAIGVLNHPILEYFTISCLKLKKCQVQYENYFDLINEFYRFIDLIIERDENFITNFEKFQNIVVIPSNISQILIDFTLSYGAVFIINKCYKNYQSESRFLIIVLLSVEDKNYLTEINNSIQNANDFNKPEHILVITFTQYLEFLGLLNKNLSEEEKEIFEKLNYIKSLSLDSLTSEDKFRALIELSYFYRNLLRESE